MRILAILILIIGVGVAGGAVYLAAQKYDKIEAALRKQAEEAKNSVVEVAPAVETTSVAVAKKAMRYGEVLTPKNVKFVEFPKESAPANAFSTEEDLFGDGEDQRIVLRAMEPNEPVLKSKVTGFGERATISAQLTPGMRAATIRIDSVSGVAGFLLPNDRVDVFLTRKGTAGLSTNVILQNIKVIAVDQFSDQDSNLARVARTATVEVTPDDAQRLALAQQIGRISLSLRQIDEVGTNEEIAPVKIDDIIKEEAPEPEAAPEPVVEKKKLCVRKGTELICN
ncbi:MAG: Flp pilus assembly protein CpaB [Pikeienuella sp.]